MATLLTQLLGNLYPTDASAVNARDIDGYQIFSHGPSGEAHALAHRLTDTAQWSIGHHLLGEWLDTHSGQGSNWVHLQFHMAIFELELGKWDSAYQRFLHEVLPVAANTAEALTDAPSLLWRLALSAPEPVMLPWEPVRCAALAYMHDTLDPFLQLHHLLALAGAGGTYGVSLWLRTVPRLANAEAQQVLERFALAMWALSSGVYSRAAELLHAVFPDLHEIGGSHAQNQLFDQIAAWAERQAGNAVSVYRQAA